METELLVDNGFEDDIGDDPGGGNVVDVERPIGLFTGGISCSKIKLLH